MYNKDFDSLNSGAPDIKITGNQRMASYGYDDAMGESRQAYDDARKRGVIPMDMEFEEFLDMMQGGGFLEGRRPQKNQRMASMEAGQEGTLEDIYADLIAQGFSPREAAKRAKELYNNMQQDMAQGGRAGIMASAPGTYTQKRKDNMMAYGGIAGADGRKRYGLGSLFQKAKDKFVDDIIPNEIKENPVLTAALIGGGINQFGIPDFVPGVGGMGQNWLGNLLGAAIPGDAAIDTVFGKEGVGYTLPELIQGMPGQGTGIAGMDDAGLNPNWAAKLAADVASGTLSAANLPDSLKGIVAQQINKQIPGLNLQTPNQAQAGFNWKIPVAAGLAAGAYTAGQPRDTLPMDKTGINFQTAQEAMDDPNLRFKPKLEDTQLAAEGGRIGFDAGGNYEAKIKELMDQGLSRELAEVIVMSGLSSDRYDIDKKAHGGRIGYKYGTKKRTGIMKMLAALDERFPELMMYGSMGAGTLLPFLKEGGRVPAQEGGLMDLGGMEKDYRQEGGFVPIGGKEKADDVPARLSKNEFVFTADAVRSAGGGDIDEGAAVMERLMENLEAGGKVSEDSQGLEGARGMFANAQQLEKRII